MVKVFCDMCGHEIDYEVDGVNLDFNHYGVVNFKKPFSAEKQLCLTCAARVCNFVERGAGEEEAEHAWRRSVGRAAAAEGGDREPGVRGLRL